MGYKGSDLGADFKAFFRKEKKRISAILTERGCTKIEMDYGFYYFSGFFTSESGQVYYLSCSDVRHFGYDKLLIRTAKHYKDSSGGSNEYCKVDKESIQNFRLQ
jgi:hypothetical protein